MELNGCERKKRKLTDPLPQPAKRFNTNTEKDPNLDKKQEMPSHTSVNKVEDQDKTVAIDKCVLPKQPPMKTFEQAIVKASNLDKSKEEEFSGNTVEAEKQLESILISTKWFGQK